MTGRLLIRADANNSIGTGHVMRCLALAQEWRKDGSPITMRGQIEPGSLRDRIQRHGVDIDDCTAARREDERADAVATIDAARTSNATWVVADSYALGEAYQKSIKDAGLRLLVLDDMAQLGHYHADFVLNQNLHGELLDYSNRDSTTRLLLGREYVMLRDEFLAWTGREREVRSRATEVLITFGGSDVLGLSSIIASQLAEDEHLHLRVLIGPATHQTASLNELMMRAGRRLEVLAGSSDVAAEMARADVAVAASGSTAWELAFMGLPAVLVATSPDQAGVAAELARHGVAVAATPDSVAQCVHSLLSDEELRSAMAAAGRALIDGGGRERVVAALMKG